MKVKELVAELLKLDQNAIVLGVQSDTVMLSDITADLEDFRFLVENVMEFDGVCLIRFDMDIYAPPFIGPPEPTFWDKIRAASCLPDSYLKIINEVYE